MPFGNKTVIKIVAGDLLYGLKELRSFAMGKAPFQGSGVMTIDTLKVLKFDAGGGPAVDREMLLKALAEHAKYRSCIDADSNEAARRKCKGGIDWAVKAKRQIHFLLDWLDITAIVEKKKVAGYSMAGVIRTAEGKDERAITGAELRWIYRNRRAQEVQDYVQFWIAGKPCLPPWVEDVPMGGGEFYSKNLWAGYIPRSEQQVNIHPAALPSDVSGVASTNIHPASIRI